MDIPKKAFLLSSAVITFFTLRYAPQVALYPKSFFWNAATLFLIQCGAQFGWSVLVYPFFFSPLRHLPSPPVTMISFQVHFWFPDDGLLTLCIGCKYIHRSLCSYL
jgi:hypothetical protein